MFRTNADMPQVVQVAVVTENFEKINFYFYFLLKRVKPFLSFVNRKQLKNIDITLIPVEIFYVILSYLKKIYPFQMHIYFYCDLFQNFT